MLSVRDLSVRYGDVLALDGLSFSVDAGQIIDIAPQRVLGIGTTVDVVEEERRQLALRGGAIVGGGGNDHGRHSRQMERRASGAPGNS